MKIYSPRKKPWAFSHQIRLKNRGPSKDSSIIPAKFSWIQNLLGFILCFKNHHGQLKIIGASEKKREFIFLLLQFHINLHNFVSRMTSGTRCGCLTNTQCPVAMRSNPCVPYKKPYPFQQRATFTFNGNNTLVWSGLAFPMEL